MHFSSAHFVVGADYSESLHGHNYKVELKLIGQLNEEGMVLDFRDVKKKVIKVCKELDHKVILPSGSSRIYISSMNGSIEVSVDDKHYVFPKADCVILPIKATTTELLAEYVARQLSFPEEFRVKVCVSESSGSKGCYESR
ncbi:MAG: 6-pyruvoyl tetrahydropterin synthase family protein [Candidatus Hodarchaeota archaeon]